MQLLLQNRLTHGQLLDAIEPDLEAGGQIIDWHACDMFPQSLIDLVVVVRCNSTILFDRLDENMDAEIMEVLLQEARDSYDEEIVVELQSDDLDQIDENIERIQAWIENWKKDHSEE
jgi:adenylate kinase